MKILDLKHELNEKDLQSINNLKNDILLMTDGNYLLDVDDIGEICLFMDDRNYIGLFENGDLAFIIDKLESFGFQFQYQEYPDFKDKNLIEVFEHFRPRTLDFYTNEELIDFILKTDCYYGAYSDRKSVEIDFPSLFENC